MAFRIGRKEASHSYPQSPAVATGTPKRFDSFTGEIVNNRGGAIAFMANGTVSATPLEYPAVETTTQAKFVANVRNNTLTASLTVALSKDGGVTTVGGVTYLPGENGVKCNGLFALPLMRCDEFYDVVLSFSGAGIPGESADISVSVELVP